ncbi:MAG: hypothetical protein WD533_06495 [Dehalococcoidia bacterium]
MRHPRKDAEPFVAGNIPHSQAAHRVRDALQLLGLGDGGSHQVHLQPEGGIYRPLRGGRLIRQGLFKLFQVAHRYRAPKGEATERIEAHFVEHDVLIGKTLEDADRVRVRKAQAGRNAGTAMLRERAKQALRERFEGRAKVK